MLGMRGQSSGLFKNTRGDIQRRLWVIQQKLEFIELLNDEIKREIEDIKAAIGGYQNATDKN